MKSLPPGQFTITSAARVPTLLNAWKTAATKKWGPNFKWVTMVGDISNMYDELDPVAAVKATKAALQELPKWLKKRVVDRVNMTRGGNDVVAGGTDQDSRVIVDFDSLLQMCEYDCTHTYYKFRGKVNRRKFGVPMGGFMSPAMAIITCAMVEVLLELDAPEGMIGGCMRYMDDVFGMIAVSTEEEELAARAWLTRVASGYPSPLVLNVEPESDRLRFLELEILVQGCEIVCGIYNTQAEAARRGELMLQRLPDLGSGTSLKVRGALVTGFVHRAFDGASDDSMLLRAVLEYYGELRRSSWGTGSLAQSLLRLSECEKVKRKETRDLLALLGKVIP